MRVYFRPLLLGGNPCLRQRVSALEAEGSEVCGRPQGGLVFLGDVVAKEAPVLHLPWFWRVASRVGHLASWARLGIFLTQPTRVRVFGRGIVFTTHDLLLRESPYPRFDRFFSRAVISPSHRAIVHGDGAEEVLPRGLALGRRILAKLLTISHAHHADVYPDHGSHTEARRTLDVDEGHFVSGGLGMLRPYPGVLALVDALRSTEGNDLGLVIAERSVDDADLCDAEDPGGLRAVRFRAIADRENGESKGRRSPERALAWRFKDSARQTARIYRTLTGWTAPPEPSDFAA